MSVISLAMSSGSSSVLSSGVEGLLRRRDKQSTPPVRPCAWPSWTLICPGMWIHSLSLSNVSALPFPILYTHGRTTALPNKAVNCNATATEKHALITPCHPQRRRSYAPRERTAFGCPPESPAGLANGSESQARGRGLADDELICQLFEGSGAGSLKRVN